MNDFNHTKTPDSENLTDLEQTSASEKRCDTENQAINKHAYANPENHPAYAPALANTSLRRHFPFMRKLCLCYGVCYLLFAYRNLNGIGSGIFSAISAAFLLIIAIHLKNKPDEPKTFSIHISWDCLIYFLGAVLISIANCFTDSSFFLFFNHVGSFLLFSIACIKLFYDDRKWDFGKYTGILFCYWIQVLEALPVPFHDWSSYRKEDNKKMSPTLRYTLIGIAFGLPILLVTTLLLASADQIFADFLNNIFAIDTILSNITEHFVESIVLVPWGFILYSLLLYIVMAALCKGGLKKEMTAPARYATPIAITIFTMIDVIYVIFAGIQFIFLFRGVTLSSYEYAEYARQGFFELLFVALINFFLVLFCNKHFGRNTVLKIVMTITCLCTFVMTASSAYRMILYIQAYHLTFLRVFVLWFLLLLSFFMAGSILSIYKENWNSFRYCLFVLTCFYTIFSLSRTDNIIAAYNTAQFEKDMDAYISGRQNQLPNLDNYLPSGYVYSKAYVPALADLAKKYDGIMGKDNQELLDGYISIENFFYEENFFEEDSTRELETSARLYDSDLSVSVFTWKHFNFIENTCYQKCKEYDAGKFSR